MNGIEVSAEHMGLALALIHQCQERAGLIRLGYRIDDDPPDEATARAMTMIDSRLGFTSVF